MSEKRSWLSRLKAGLTKTRQGFVGRVKEALSLGERIDEDLYERLEEVLIEADVGVNTALELIETIRDRVAAERVKEPAAIQSMLAEEMRSLLVAEPLKEVPAPGERLLAIALVGVNGAGKTTTAGKLASRFAQQGKRVLIGAGDTFRAAAIDQLKVWADRAGADFIAHQPGSDPAAVAYDAVQAARSRGVDVLLLDTAGRLQTKSNLMQELGKVHRVLERELGRSPDETLLVVDATTGQNGLSQGRLFQESVPLTGIALTKLDGTAKGGIVVALGQQLRLPVKLVGIGEGSDDLRDFDADAFIEALFAPDAER